MRRGAGDDMEYERRLASMDGETRRPSGFAGLEQLAPKYDSNIAFFERLFFAGGREWVCSQAEVNVLEIAIGTGRNLPFYPPGVKLTGVDLSPAMLEIARRRAIDRYPSRVTST